MNGPSWATHGDSDERNRWPEMRKHSLYEAFWQVHVFTLRDGTGHIRQDVDERLESIAQAHYKYFVSVSIALDFEIRPAGHASAMLKLPISFC